MINIVNARARRLYQSEFERQMNVLENTFFKEIRPLLGRQFFNAADLVKNGVGLEGVNHAVDLGRRRLVILFSKHYKRVSATFSKKTYSIIERAQKSFVVSDPISLYPSELKTPMDEFWLAINKWSRIQAAQKIHMIQTTTKKVIAKVIRRGMQDGESSVDIAKRLRKTSQAINPHRAKTIALTETHTAAVKAVDTAIASTRIEMEREWVSARDKRTRTRDRGGKFEHFKNFPAGPNRERVTQNEEFVGTGQPMRYPGDPKGSAGNVVRCRCVLLYHTVKVTDKLKPHEPEEEVPSFIPAKNIDELNDKMSKMKMGYFEFDKKYSKKDALNIGNQIAENSFNTLEKYPGLKKALDKQSLFTTEVTKERVLPSSSGGALGLYKRQYFSIELAGSTRKVHSLGSFGKSNYAMNKDLFSIHRHELGHHVYYEIDKKAFSELYKKEGKEYFGKHVTKYAMKNSQEAFCECLSGYTSPLYGKDAKKRFPKELEKIMGDILKGK